MRRLAMVASVLLLAGCGAGGGDTPSATETVTVEATSTVTATETVRVTVSASPASTSAPTPAESSRFDADALAEWLDLMNTGRTANLFTEADAAWSCDQWTGPDAATAAWWAITDERVRHAGRLLCPEFRDAAERATRGFWSGKLEVGSGEGQVMPGTYVTAPGIEDCYWARISPHGTTLANDFVTFAPQGVRVTISADDGGFEAEGCGGWLPAE